METDEYTDWDKDAGDNDFVQFPATMRFLGDNPRKGLNNWNRTVWRWDVQVFEQGGTTYDSTLSVTSKRLLRALLRFKPLKGHILTIERHGEGMTTIYEVHEGVKP